MHGTISIVEERADEDVDPFGPGNAGLTALELLVKAAEKCGDAALRESCSELDDQGLAPLHYLAQAGLAAHPAALTMLLRGGADPNIQSDPTESEYTSGQWGRKTAEGTLEALESAAVAATARDVDDDPDLAFSERAHAALAKAGGAPKRYPWDRARPVTQTYSDFWTQQM